MKQKIFWICMTLVCVGASVAMTELWWNSKR